MRGCTREGRKSFDGRQKIIKPTCLNQQVGFLFCWRAFVGLGGRRLPYEIHKVIIQCQDGGITPSIRSGKQKFNISTSFSRDDNSAFLASGNRYGTPFVRVDISYCFFDSYNIKLSQWRHPLHKSLSIGVLWIWHFCLQLDHKSRLSARQPFFHWALSRAHKH